MSIIDTIINKALEFEGITEKPAGSNNVQFNTHYYGHEVEDGKPNKDDAYECFILGKHTARNGVAGISPPRREFQKC